MHETPARHGEALTDRAGRIRRSRQVRILITLPVIAVGAVVLAAFQDRAEERVVLPTPVVAPPEPPIELPVEMNARVEKWMRRFMTDQRGTFQTYLTREGRFGDLIRRKLRERGMPEDLLYLAMIESGFSPKATSKVFAVGVWQFMSPTATQFGLRVDEWVDERRDPVRATDAALDYLSFLHERYGSWYLAAAAYNSGPSRVNRALKRNGGERWGEEALYWEIIEHLPRETREYVPRILAATTLAREAGRYGFHVKPAAPYAYDRVWVPGTTALASVARAVGVETSVMRDLNPHLVRGVTPPGASYGLRVPTGSAPTVVAALVGRPAAQMAD